MEVLLLAVMAISNIGCFLLGAKVGQAVSKGEKVELPSIDLLKAAREREAKQEAELEQSQITTILENVERYDGTDNGQKDVPRR